MPRRARRKPGFSLSPPVQRTLAIYTDSTEQPLYCLVFLLPFVAAYEVGAAILRPFLLSGDELVARRLLDNLLSWFGASAFWLPGAALLVTLLAWHVLSRRPWQIRAWVVLLMFVESALLTIPMLVFGRLMVQAGDEAVELRANLVLAIGAGIYEELVFRLYFITLLTLLFVRVLKVHVNVAAPMVVFLAALVFAAAHFAPLGQAVFAWPHFLALMALGAYLSIVFIGRGLGVVTGCHTAYDLIVLLWLR